MRDFFSIKESLIKLKTKNYDKNNNHTIDFLIENYDEYQLKILSNSGLKIDNNIIRLYFIENVGFRCMNERDNIYGKLPICRNIENYMNNLYLDSIKLYYS